MHETLRRGQPNQVMLFPLTTESHQEFLVDISQGKNGYGEHTVYAFDGDGWQTREYA
jgi:hypothetical protein